MSNSRPARLEPAVNWTGRGQIAGKHRNQLNTRTRRGAKAGCAPPGYAAIPWMCATVADLVVGGWLIDHLIKRGYDETPVRKTVLVLGMLLGLAVFGATFTIDPV